MALDILPKVITVIFFLIVLSYYALLFVRKKGGKVERKFSGISVIIPAHNESKHIENCIKSIINAKFSGRKEIIVVDDGSTDDTVEKAKKFGNKVKVIRKSHTGKADSLNAALGHANYETVAVVDADSCISRNSLIEAVKVIQQKGYAASSCIVKVKNRKRLIGMWLHIEQLYNSLLRSMFSKLNANIVTPGPLGVYRKDALIEVGGFSTKGFAEDVDVTIRLIRRGYKIGFAEKAVSETVMPYTAKGFLRQRTRFARGIINILKKHISYNKHIIDIYTLPLLLFNYIQAIIMGSFTIYQIVSGYLAYFASKNIYISFSVLKFFFEWFSVVGFVKWSVKAFTGEIPLTAITAIGIFSTLLTYPLYLYAIIKFDRKFDIWHLVPIVFMFPFWLLVMIIYVLCLPESLKKHQYNIWKKSE